MRQNRVTVSYSSSTNTITLKHKIVSGDDVHAQASRQTDRHAHTPTTVCALKVRNAHLLKNGCLMGNYKQSC